MLTFYCKESFITEIHPNSAVTYTTTVVSLMRPNQRRLFCFECSHAVFTPSANNFSICISLDHTAMGCNKLQQHCCITNP